MNKKNIIFALILAIEIVILGIHTLSFNKNYSSDILQDDLLLYMGEENGYEPGAYCDHSYNNGQMITTNPIYLQKGIYDISYTYDTNNQYQDAKKDVYSEIESIDDISENKGADNVSSDVIGIYSSSNSGRHLAYINRDGNFRINFPVLEDGDYIMVGDIHIEYLRGRTILHEFTILFFFFAVFTFFLAVYLFFRDKAAKWFEEKFTTTALLAGIVALSSYPLVHKGVYFGDDIYYHFTRFVAIADGLRSGIFPVKIHPIWCNGYGYADGVGYGSLLLYPASVLIILGFSLAFTYKFYVLMMNTLVVIISYKAFKSITKKEYLGIAGSAFYSLMGFHLHSVYTGALVGEFAAYAFLPLILLGMWDIYTENEELRGYKGILEMAVGIAMTIETHVHSTFILVMVIPVVCLIFFKKTFSKKIFFNLLKTLGLIILLGLHFMIPVVDYLMNVPMLMGEHGYILWGNATDPEYLFMTRPDPVQYTGGWAALGFASLISLFICAAVLGKGYFGKLKTTVTKLLIFTAVLIFMCTKWFPYYDLYRILPEKIYSALEILQFPWHFLGVISTLTVLLTVLSLNALEDNMIKEGKLHGTEIAAVIAFCLLAITIGQDLTYYNELFATSHTMTAIDSDKCYFQGIDEFGIVGSSTKLAYKDSDIALPETEGVNGTITSRKATTIVADITNDSTQSVTAEFPLWNYKRYKAVSGKTKLNMIEADSHRVAVEIPSGFTGSVKVYFSEPWYWRFTELLSLATVICLIIFIRKSIGRVNNSTDTVEQ